MNSTELQLSPDTQAILLLCGTFGKKSDNRNIQPLTSLEYAWLAQWLHEQQMRPADLLEPAVAEKLKPVAHHYITASRLVALLRRQPAMTAAVETWAQQGVWILSRGDKTYPSRLKTRLGQAAPPLLYGIGPLLLLQKEGLAIVGNRDTNKEVLEFTKRLAKVMAQQGITVISGGTRGINTEAVLTALAQGRCAIGVLADNLAKALISGKYRDALQEERVVLLSPFDPQTGFNVSNTLACQKYLYTLSEGAIVINSDFEQEGSWAGAMENLRAGWVPLWVRQDATSIGNQQLLNQGAIAIDQGILQHTSDLREHLQQLIAGTTTPSSPSMPEAKTTVVQVPEEAPSPVSEETLTVTINGVKEETVSSSQETAPAPVKLPKLTPRRVTKVVEVTGNRASPEPLPVTENGTEKTSPQETPSAPVKPPKSTRRKKKGATVAAVTSTSVAAATSTPVTTEETPSAAPRTEQTPEESATPVNSPQSALPEEVTKVIEGVPTPPPVKTLTMPAMGEEDEEDEEEDEEDEEIMSPLSKVNSATRWQAVSNFDSLSTIVPPDLFTMIWPYMDKLLRTEITEEELVKRLNVHPAQLRLWLKRAMSLGKVKRSKNPVRYVRIFTPAERQPSLF